MEFPYKLFSSHISAHVNLVMKICTNSWWRLGIRSALNDFPTSSVFETFRTDSVVMWVFCPVRYTRISVAILNGFWNAENWRRREYGSWVGPSWLGPNLTSYMRADLTLCVRASPMSVLGSVWASYIKSDQMCVCFWCLNECIILFVSLEVFYDVY